MNIRKDNFDFFLFSISDFRDSASMVMKSSTFLANLPVYMLRVNVMRACCVYEFVCAFACYACVVYPICVCTSCVRVVCRRLCVEIREGSMVEE